MEFKDIPVSVNRDIDILFIIDDSPSMLDKQTNLKANFPNFINVLNTIEGGLPNVHLGVVSTDLGTKGAADAQAGSGIGSGPGSCSGNGKSGTLQTNGSTLVNGNFINDQNNGDGTRTKNYTGTLEAAFSAIASLGASGCGFEQHIEAAKRAVNNNPSNAGFIRPNAYLALIFIQDEDDCSIAHSTLLGNDTNTLGPLQSFRCNRFGHTCTTPPGAPGGTNPNAPQASQEGPKGGCTSNETGTYLTKIEDYVSFFKTLKSDPLNVIVAAIAGPTTPYEVEYRTPPGGGTAIPAVAHSCSYQGGNGTEVADPSTRLVEFVNSFPNRNTFQTICTPDLSPALTVIAQLLRTVIGSPCIEGKLADVDPETAGDQYDCSVSDVRNYGKANQTEEVLVQCNNTTDPESATNKPCWAIHPDPEACMTAPNLTLEVFRTVDPAQDTHVVSYCVTEA